jgi:hypothetical protein
MVTAVTSAPVNAYARYSGPDKRIHGPVVWHSDRAMQAVAVRSTMLARARLSDSTLLHPCVEPTTPGPERY